MRYYDIQVTPASGGGAAARRWTSYLNGRNLAGALNVELDVPVIGYATPMGAAFVRVWGIPLVDISQASDFNGASIKVFAGFQKGLPLANPAQAGLIMQGTVLQAFGNWIGTDMTLDLIVYPGVGTPSDPKNITINWKKGTKLSDSIASTLKTAFPNFQQTISISDNLVRSNDEVGYYQDLTQYAQYLSQASRSIVKTADYPGVSIVINGTMISAFDNTPAASSTPKQIDFKDLIGQPTWIEGSSLTFKTPMRADLKVGDDVRLPQTLITNTAAAATSLVNQKLTFQGGFKITMERHVGNFRQPDGASWVTVFQAAPLAVKGATQ